MKIIKLISSIWMGLLAVTLAVGCSGSISDASDGAAPAEDGQYKAIMAGSSGYGTMTVDSENLEDSNLEIYFDTNQSGTYDIVIRTNGIDLKLGFTNKDGVVVKLGDGNVLEVTIPNHGAITTAVEKFSGNDDHLEIYTGVMGLRESVFSNTNTVDETASEAIAGRVELSKIVFNAILNTNTKKFRYIIKGIDVKFFDLPTITEDQKTEIKKLINSYQNGVSEGDYTVEGDIYTFTIGDRVQKLRKVGDSLKVSRFQALFCDQTYIVAGLSSGVGVGAPAPNAPKKHIVVGCPGITGGYVDGYKPTTSGEYYLGSESVDAYEQTPAAGAPTTTRQARAMEIYAKLVKRSK